MLKGPLNPHDYFAEMDPLTCTLTSLAIFTIFVTSIRPLGPKKSCISFEHDNHDDIL